MSMATKQEWNFSKQWLVHVEQEWALSEYLERLCCLAYSWLLNIKIQFQKKVFAKKTQKTNKKHPVHTEHYI